MGNDRQMVTRERVWYSPTGRGSLIQTGRESLILTNLTGCAGWPAGRSQGKAWARALTVVFVARQGMLSGFRIGWFEEFQRTGGIG